MMNLLNNKSGEITTQQIVFLIILITSFVVILFFFFRLNLGETTNKEICHNSVVLKGKSIISGNLDCRTNYVCISGGEKCEGINPTQTVKVNSNNKGEVLKAIADEMVDCWWMFGEGKVDYAGSSIIGRSCAVCSIVKFDENFQEEITYKDLSDFLKENKKDETQTYFDYLFKNGVPNLMVTDSPISYGEQYTIITGRSDAINVPFIGINIKDSGIVPVHFIKSSDLSQTECTSYDITKA